MKRVWPLEALVSAEAFRPKVAAAGLQITLETTLAGHPGSVHWHLRAQGERRGTLEFTWCPSRAWLEVRASREAPWIDAAVARLQGP
jgi:hypothetical protein